MNTQATARTNGQNIANLPAKQRVAALLKSNKNAIAQVLPKHVSPERLMQVAFTAVRTTPKLLECNTDSLIGGIIQCAQLGLEPNTVLGHCYLIPFKQEVQIIVGYKGLIDLARRSGQIVSIAAHVVRENDDFEYQYGLEPILRHVPAESTDAGEITHAYAVAHLKDGGNAFEVMTLSDIHLVMLQSQSKGKWGPWKEHFAEMARKTAIRRLSKFLPLSIEFSTAVAMDAQSSNQEGQHLEDVLSGDYTVVDDFNDAPQPTDTTEALKDRLRKQDPDQGLADVGDKAGPEEQPSGAYDSAGTKFDPEFHQVDRETGEPIYNKDKTFRLRPGKAQAAAEAADDADSSEAESEHPGGDLGL